MACKVLCHAQNGVGDGSAGGEFSGLEAQTVDFLAEHSEVDRFLQEIGDGQPFCVNIFVAETERELLVHCGEHEDGDSAEAASDLTGELKATTGVFGKDDV